MAEWVSGGLAEASQCHLVTGQAFDLGDFVPKVSDGCLLLDSYPVSQSEIPRYAAARFMNRL